MSQTHLIPMEMLYGYAEGTLNEVEDRQVEQHLHECSECAAAVDQYTCVLGEFEAPPASALSELIDASARLDQRMAPALPPKPLPSQNPEFSALCRIYGIGTLLNWKDPLLQQLFWPKARRVLSPMLASAAAAETQALLVLPNVPAFASDGRVERTTAKMSGRQDGSLMNVLVETELAYVGWKAAMAYLVDSEGAAPIAVSLHSGRIDEEGLLEFEIDWPQSRALEAERVKFCLSSPTS